MKDNDEGEEEMFVSNVCLSTKSTAKGLEASILDGAETVEYYTYKWVPSLSYWR